MGPGVQHGPLRRRQIVREQRMLAAHRLGQRGGHCCWCCRWLAFPTMTPTTVAPTETTSSTTEKMCPSRDFVVQSLLCRVV